ncbi:MAG: hypothetical protein KZQ64_09420 [gamma proteobacterium symbiont of Bathyaustriella thionipta]|nr:hypothetical protein [gamma proteobacterium symbiont of Bathyaustriella thionipta]MCU7951211.1 hypothetical protein [gamma proteobacterium symbiont of Bathyaustriella thionipta]MCU7953593.1 hypothetical protein [gamma proteobacterium symbiont of Bathyaustriella thionipta]MCU7957728.1 hypothetical protein [gamma proteobacterium symbiont of Bathyaustriella thionipta]MCU7966403.1 hypothetical protein [gamma proteobacterium symbiont of Bathyaustriella thionipta]
MTIQSKEGQVELGPFSGAQQNQGYQLFISPHLNQVELLRTGSRGRSVVEAKNVTVSLNQAHVFEWLRDASGMMTIAMDGEQLFQVSDRGYRDEFSGFALQNLSGSVILHELNIVAKKD